MYGGSGSILVLPRRVLSSLFEEGLLGLVYGLLHVAYWSSGCVARSGGSLGSGQP